MMIIDPTTGLPGYSFEDAYNETLDAMLAETQGDPETPSPIREPGDPLGEPHEPVPIPPQPEPDEEDEEDEEDDLSDAEAIDTLMQGMTETLTLLVEQSKILLDIGLRLARIESQLEEI